MKIQDLNLEFKENKKQVKFNNKIIEVTTYLPFEQKLELIETVINSSVDENGYYNVAKIKMYEEMNIVAYYGNIDINTDDAFKLYDAIISSGLYKTIFDNIDDGEYSIIHDTIMGMIKSIYEYNRSALGVLKMVTADYENLNLDTTEISQKIADPNNLKLVKNIMDKLD